MQCLKKEYSYNNWKGLMSVILISLQLFNRRRAGEMDRAKIEDYLKYERLKDDYEMLGCMSAEEKKRQKGYIRFLSRGKRCRGVPVMVNREKFEGIQMILKFRKQTNISERNPYLFGLPGKDDFNHLLATRLLNQYSKLCGAKKPHTLCGTELRKHIATKCGTMNLGGVELKDVADYLGHNENIHLDHYRSSATKDIVRMSNILECAQGSINESLDEIGERYSISENSCNGIFEESKNEDNFNIPTSDLCHDVISSNDILSRRSATQLKAYVANCIEKRKQSLKSDQHTKVQRKHWGSAERNAVLTLFQDEMKNKKLPSLKRCEEVLKENSIFEGRTPIMLKAFFNNTKKKKHDK
ncbi:uncharacterized protein LOC130444668 [Diorhabda sublineata]|uniref:uncharacterized protein LOC130444668 n=1 Tax=Diorhabda sublineata TaxID=1163346 RepID=UPI0024E15948|nr:uncharacterized protein LOC130444668 [Diorhabda sublineata]